MKRRLNGILPCGYLIKRMRQISIHHTTTTILAMKAKHWQQIEELPIIKIICVSQLSMLNKKTDWKLYASQIENGIEMSTESCYRDSYREGENGFWVWIEHSGFTDRCFKWASFIAGSIRFPVSTCQSCLFFRTLLLAVNSTGDFGDYLSCCWRQFSVSFRIHVVLFWDHSNFVVTNNWLDGSTKLDW